MTGRSSNKSKKDGPSVMPSQGLFVLLFLPALVYLCTWCFDARTENARYFVDLSKSELTVPEDMQESEQVRSALQRLLAEEQPLNMLDTETDSVLKHIFESSPLVKKFRGSNRVFPGRMNYDIELKQPFAAAQIRERLKLVDQHGDLLPLTIEPADVTGPIITIHPRGQYAGVDGIDHDWVRSALKHGVQVLKDLDAVDDGGAFDDFSVLAIDVSNHMGRLDKSRSEISLVTDRTWFDADAQKSRRCLLHWGRSTIHPLATVELSVEQKLANLRTVLRSRPSGLNDLHAADLRFRKPYYLKK